MFLAHNNVKFHQYLLFQFIGSHDLIRKIQKTLESLLFLFFQGDNQELIYYLDKMIFFFLY